MVISSENSPVIKTGVAARRLKVLFPRGVEPTPHLLEAFSPSSSSSTIARDEDSHRRTDMTLKAILLDRPARVEETDNAASRQGIHRDILAEVAVAPRTLDALKLPAGAIVKVTNPKRPEVRPHLVRIWPSADIAAPHTVGLPPTLAFNLGLALHLLVLLSSNEDTTTSTSNTTTEPMAWVTVEAYHPHPVAADQNEEDTSSPPSIEKQEQGQEQEQNGSYTQDQKNEGEVALWPQPPPLQPCPVPIAKVVHLAVVREPASGWMPPTLDGQQVHAFLSSDINGSSSSQGTDPVEAMKTYFLGGIRVVCEGDVLAVCKPESSSSLSRIGQVLENLNRPVQDDGSGGSGGDMSLPPPSLLYFRVTSVVPEGKAMQAVDIGTTVVKLSGTCCANLPVGLRQYMAPVTTSSSSSSLLGWYANAAALGNRQSWSLPYVGRLMPVWREIALLASTVLHPATAAIPLRLSILVHGPPGSGRRTAVSAAAAALGCHYTMISARDIKGDGPIPESKIAEGLRVSFDVAGRYRPCFLTLSDFELLAAPGGDAQAEAGASRLGSVLAECVASGLHRSHSTHPSQLYPCPIFLIACATSPEDVHPAMRRCFTHEIQVDAPDAGQRETLLRSFMRLAGKDLGPEEWADVARHTSGLLPRDLRSFAADACAAAALAALPPAAVLCPKDNELEEEEEEEGYAVVGLVNNKSISMGGNNNNSIVVPPHSLEDAHISIALTAARERMATGIGAPKIPNVLWDDVGGLEDVKLSILDTVELPLKHPELFSSGLRRRSGVLLYGPPGTGKTLLAKAVATECAVNFLSVKGPELINMYVGESERQVREVFARARRAKPCVIFFDELDSLAPARGRGSDSGGVMDRVVSQVLAEIDSAQGEGGTDDVFIIGATNRPDLLDPALLRPGRLDKLLYVGVASDDASQLKVIKALTRKFTLAGDVDLQAVAAQCPPRLTGADLYALCSDAWMMALKRHVAGAKDGESEGEDEGAAAVAVGQIDFEAALVKLRPSLSERDIVRYERIRDQYAGKK